MLLDPPPSECTLFTADSNAPRRSVQIEKERLGVESKSHEEITHTNLPLDSNHVIYLPQIFHPPSFYATSLKPP